MFKKIFVSVLVLTYLTGCAPRGESNSLSEVYAAAEARYKKIRNKQSLDPTVATRVDALTAKLESLLKADLSKKDGQIANNIAQSLSELSRKSSYTNRPAMGELASQYLNISTKTDAATIKLLISRTYGILVSEFEAGKFSL